MMIKGIISGGQTGADRGALDFAIKHDTPHGGWVPKGRKTEDGTLPEKYNLREMATGSYPKRTEKNILDADGTLIISHGPLTGGSARTRELAKRHSKPWIHIDSKTIPYVDAARMIREWIERNAIGVLNIAGPRASKGSEIYQATMTLLERTFPVAENHERNT
jgi:hypothetical protein